MRKLLLSIGLLINTIVLQAQSNAPVSLFGQNQTVFNPGAVGNEEVLAASFFARQVWVGFDNAPSIQAFSAHAPLRNPSVAMGIMVEHDSWGLTDYTGLYLNYAYRMRIGENRLALGLKLGLYSASRNQINLRDDEPDPTNLGTQTFHLPNSGVGLLYTSNFFWMGVSVPRMLSFKSDPSGTYTVDHNFAAYEYYISAGGEYPVNPDITLEPSVLFVQATSFKYQVNAMASYKDVYSAGLGYRKKEALILLLTYMVNRQFSAGYCYDFNLGEMKNYSSGSHEIQLQYKFGYKVNASNPRGF